MDLKQQIPNRKVGSGLGYGLPIAVILSWLIKEVIGMEVPTGVTESMSVLIASGIAWAVSEK